MAEPITNVLGVVGMKTRGEYDSETTYEKLNVVTYEGSSYCAKTDTQGNLPTNETYWDLIAEKGDKGDIPVKGVDYYTTADKNELINELEVTLNEDVTDEVTEQLADLTSATPIVVSSISDMIDESKIYVLSTSGHWYWYNGEEWTDGGVYQATAIDDNSVYLKNLSTDLCDILFGSCTDATKIGWRFSSTSSASSTKISNQFYLKKGTTITVSSSFVSNYHWRIDKYESSKFSSHTKVFDFTTATSYTTTEDMLACFCYKPIDDDWSTTTYTVNKFVNPNNSDITSIKFYYPTKNEFLLEDIDSKLLISCLCPGGLDGGTKIFTQANNRLSSVIQFKSKHPIKFNIESGYKYGIIVWSNFGSYGSSNFVSDSGWLTTDYMLPANKIFTYTISKTDNTSLDNVSDIENKVILTSYSDFDYTDDKIEEVINQLDNADYYYHGEEIDFRNRFGYSIEELMEYNTASNSQGFDIYGNYIFQLYAGGTIKVNNIVNGEEISTISNLGFNHGDTCQFSNTKYDENDDFPLLYVTSDTTPSVVHVIRITDIYSGYKIKSYDLGSESGYYAGHCYDFENNILYCFGYKANSFTSGTNNATIISVFDMSQETLVSGTTYSLYLIERYEKPFIYCIQGQKFFKGKCFLLSSYSPSQSPNTIYVYDPIRKLISSYFDQLPTAIENSELEDLAFKLDSYGKNYDIIIGNRVKYYLFKIK